MRITSQQSDETFRLHSESDVTHVQFSVVGLWFILLNYLRLVGYAVAHLVEALRCKPEGRGFDSRWCQLNFSLTILPAALWPWG